MKCFDSAPRTVLQLQTNIAANFLLQSKRAVLLGQPQTSVRPTQTLRLTWEIAATRSSLFSGALWHLVQPSQSAPGWLIASSESSQSASLNPGARLCVYQWTLLTSSPPPRVLLAGQPARSVQAVRARVELKITKRYHSATISRCRNWHDDRDTDFRALSF